MTKNGTFILTVLLLLWQGVQAQITVDGNPSDWTGTAPTNDNTWVYSAGTAGGYNEWIWKDAASDERTNFGSDSRINITEIRVSGDNNNIYFLIRMEDIDADNGDGAPQIQISIDKDMDGTGSDWLAENSDTQVPADARWEHLIYTKFGPNGNTAQPYIWDEGFTNNRAAGSAVCSATNDVIEMSIPWSELGSPITADNTVLRFTFSSYRQNAGNPSEVWDTGGDNSKGDCLDYATTTTGNTYDALVGFNSGGTNDAGRLDDYQDITFLNDPDQTLNVQLSSFTAFAGNNKVTLQWITESELGNLGFILERGYSAEGPFEEIANYENDPALKGAGTSSAPHHYAFTDKSVLNGVTYWYRLSDVDMNGIRTSHAVISATPQAQNANIDVVDNGIPKQFKLAQNYPNPFNPQTHIRFEVPLLKEEPAMIRLMIFDVTGKKVAELVNQPLTSGKYEVTWNGTDQQGLVLPSGVYFYTLQSKYFSATKKLMLLR